MKLSKHSYDNEVVKKLIDSVKEMPEKQSLKKEASKSSVSGHDIFSSVGKEEYEQIVNEEQKTIVNELKFAAQNAQVSVSEEQAIDFVKQSMKDGLRGKSLERAARHYCHDILHNTSYPVGDKRNSFSSELLDNANSSAIKPAGYNPEYGQNETRTGGYMGMRKNPNSIWDSTRLTEFAKKTSGDESIKKSKEAQDQFVLNQKEQYWKDLQEKLSDKEVIQEKTSSVANVSTVEKVGKQNLPANSMSMFDGNRDFENIPDKTEGETIKESSQERATKKQAAKEEWNKSEPSKKVNMRSAIDNFFEGLTDSK